jgi:Ser/Thr protein kinase RdoA (MazF antagonist)
VAEVHHRIQRAALGAVDGLAAAGVPDRRGPRFAAFVRGALAGHDLDALVPDLDARLGALADCGLPDTLVHGDLHAGNARLRDGAPPVVFDWGDSSLGHPAFDVLRLTGDLEPDDREAVVAAWANRWRAVVPGADPERAVALARPLAPLNGAAVYATFLANIEPAEHPYHRRDVPDSLAEVAAQLARERPTVGG